MKNTSKILLTLVCLSSLPTYADTVTLPADVLRDKVRGGLLGQMLGNLNGLRHENQYVNEPGMVESYTPALPEGAWTDDDTDFEWVYIVEMQRGNEIFLPPETIANLWKTRINRRIWCSNQYARQLMDLGLVPPLTGRFALNPWAEFNISGQFLCETFALLAPAMPQTAARIGLHYTQVAIDLEPAQTTQMFTSMIATAFVEDDINNIIDAGLAAVDAKSELRAIVADMRAWHKEYPDDWRACRAKLKEKYSRYNGAMRDINGYELNTAVTIAALLYGGGDLAETLRHAFNFGWDCDNSAATAGTVVGVMKGYRWMLSQGWQIVDRYKNTTRDNMPMDETISSFADRLVDLSETVIAKNGGDRTLKDGQPVYRIQTETPAPIAPLPTLDEQARALRSEYELQVTGWILKSDNEDDRARGAYLAICLDFADQIKTAHPAEWQRALDALQKRWNIVQALYNHAPFPAGDRLREKAQQAGLMKPEERKDLW